MLLPVFASTNVNTSLTEDLATNTSNTTLLSINHFTRKLPYCSRWVKPVTITPALFAHFSQSLVDRFNDNPAFRAVFSLNVSMLLLPVDTVSLDGTIPKYLKVLSSSMLFPICTISTFICTLPSFRKINSLVLLIVKVTLNRWFI